MVNLTFTSADSNSWHSWFIFSDSPWRNRHGWLELLKTSYLSALYSAKEIDPVYSLLKCAADLPKVSRATKEGQPASQNQGAPCSGLLGRHGDSSGSTSKASSPSSSGNQWCPHPQTPPCFCVRRSKVLLSPVVRISNVPCYFFRSCYFPRPVLSEVKIPVRVQVQCWCSALSTVVQLSRLSHRKIQCSCFSCFWTIGQSIVLPKFDVHLSVVGCCFFFQS